MRLFVAVNFTAEFKKELLEAINRLRKNCITGNFSRPENLHLTLTFIGETRDTAGAKAAVDACDAEPFDLVTICTGRFGDVFWVGLEESAQLKALSKSLQTELRSRGFAIEKRPFRPHITLARRITVPSGLNFEVPKASMTVRRISLMKSEHINGILTYSEIFGKDLRI